EPNAFLHHQLQIVVSCEWAMFDLCAAGEHSRTNRILVSVYECAQAKLLRFLARGVELFLREQHLRAAHAAGSEDLDQVGACFFLFSDEGANLVRRAGLFVAAEERLSGSEDTWTGQRTPRDRLTQRNIVW